MSNHHEDELAELTDKVVEGILDNDDLESLRERISDSEELDNDELKDLFEDLINLRYNYTLEMVSKNIGSYLLRPKKSAQQALRDYKKCLVLVKFLLVETRKALDEQEENDEFKE
jgi:hypothetical protein